MTKTELQEKRLLDIYGMRGPNVYATGAKEYAITYPLNGSRQASEDKRRVRITVMLNISNGKWTVMPDFFDSLGRNRTADMPGVETRCHGGYWENHDGNGKLVTNEWEAVEAFMNVLKELKKTWGLKVRLQWVKED